MTVRAPRDRDAPPVPARDERGPAQAGGPPLSAADQVLSLQRTVGNRALTAALLQRDPVKPLPTPAGKKPLAGDPRGSQRTVHQLDPASWAKQIAKITETARSPGKVDTILTVAINTSFAFDGEGGSVREVPIALPDNTKGDLSYWFVDLVHADWRDAEYYNVPLQPPLSEADVKQLCQAMGYTYGASGKVWVFLLLVPDSVFARPKTVEKPDGDTPAARRKANDAVEKLTTAWRDRPSPPGSALVGTPTFKARYSERTGWHVRITLDQESTEVPLRPGDTDKQVQDRAEAAIAGMRGKYAPRAQHPPPSSAGKQSPTGPKPPPWYVPFDEDPAVKGAREAANAPPLPAVLLFKPEPTNKHPTVMAGATYDFRMEVQWQFAGQYGWSAAGNAGYYWELLAATESDWYRLAGEKPPAPAPATATPPPTPAATAPAAPTPAAPPPAPAQTAAGPGSPTTPPPAPTEQARIGSGTKVTKSDDITAARRAEGRHVGEDMAADYEEGDYSGFAGEAVAGGFRIVSTQVISAIGDVLDYRDPSSRRVEFPSPGYYIVRCMSASTHAGTDPEKDFIRAPSIAVIPVKAQLNWAVAKVAAREDLVKGAGQGTYERYVAELESTRAFSEHANKLQQHLFYNPILKRRLDTDPVGASAELDENELSVLTVADLNRLSVDEIAREFETEVKDSKGHAEFVKNWRGELKEDYAVGAALVAEDSGQQIKLKLMVGQATDSTDASPHWIVFDITSESSRDRYEGRGTIAGAPLHAKMGGHGAALREALRKFAGENPYGYGEIGLAWPDSFGPVELKGRDLPRHLRSAPDAAKRKEKRHQAYVDIATWFLPVAKAAKLKALVKAAEAFIALLGAKNAIEALRRRGRTGHLDEPGTLLELVQVIGAVKTLGAGAKFVFEANELVTAARGVGTSIELLTKLEGGLQIISIPFVVRDQLRAIDAMGPETSGTHKAARMAFILGRAIRDAQVAVHSIHPGEEASFYDDSKEIEHEGKPKDIEHEGTAPPAGGRQEHEGPPPSPGEPGAKREHPDAPGKKPTAEGEPSKPSSHEEPGATRTDEQLRSQVRAEVRDDTIVAETSVVNAHNEPHEYHRSRDGRIRRCSWACMLMIDNVRERIRAMDAALPESTPLVKDWREIIRRADDLQRRSTAASAEQTTRENRLAGLKEGSPKWTISKNALANWMKERNRVFNDTAAEIEQALSRIERRAGIEAKPDVRVNAPIESSAQLLEDFADVANDERYKAELEAIRRLESDSGQRNEALNRLALLRQAMVRHVEENIPAQVEAARAARQRVGQGTTGPNKGVLAGSGDGRTRVESGWWDAEDPGITQATEQVVAIAQQGYAFPAHNFDPPDRPGLYYASHAEKQMNALRPGEPIGVSEDMCFDCYNYFRWRAQAMGRPLVVADPTVTRVFYPDGRVSAPPRAGAPATQTANAPR